MLTIKQVLRNAADRDRDACELIDARDFARLAAFIPYDKWEVLGLELREDADPPESLPWTEENILAQLEGDLAFAFEKALDQRGLSAGMMYEVVLMWMWVLEDDLQSHVAYAMYGLPLYKAVAVKYGFPNPIGDDNGNESKYDE